MKNYHTHTTRCRHAFGKDRDYIEKAIKAGITELGFSDHAPMLFPDDKYYSTFRMYPNQVDDYINSVNLLREEYKDRIKIHLGFEIEYLPELFEKTSEWLEEKGAEYFILGQHFTNNEYDKGSFYCGSKSYSKKDFDKYINQALDGLKTGRFLYIAHPDLFNFRGSTKIYIEKMTYFCTEIKKLGFPVEFNLLGFAQNRNYPNRRFWKIVSEVKNDVVIGFDAHSPEVFQNRKIYDDAVAYLQNLGITPIELEFRATAKNK